MKSVSRLMHWHRSLCCCFLPSQETVNCVDALDCLHEATYSVPGPSAVYYALMPLADHLTRAAVMVARVRVKKEAEVLEAREQLHGSHGGSLAGTQDEIVD